MFKKWFIRSVIGVAVLAAGVLGWWLRGRSVEAPLHPGPSVQQIQQLSTLVTTRIDLADVQEVSIHGYTGGVRVTLLVKGDFLLGVDLAEARFESVDPQRHTAVLWLPAPRVTSPRVDHGHTKLVQVQGQGLWALVPVDAGRSRVIEQAYARAQQSVARAGADPLMIEASRRHAQQVVTTFFEALGWSVRVQWTGAPGR